MKKLVRDLIPKIMTADGKKVIFYQASEEEYRLRLKDKLREEVEEFCRDENLEEMADILEVLEAISNAFCFSADEVLKKRREKNNKRGKFEKRIIAQF